MLNRKLVSAPETTTICPECGSKTLVRIGTQNIKMCADCPTDIDWRIKPGEPAIYGGTDGQKAQA